MGRGEKPKRKKANRGGEKTQNKVLGIDTNVSGFPGGPSGKEPACQSRRCKRRELDPWVGKIPWRRAWQPTPVFLPGESQGWGSLVGFRLWGRTVSDTTDVT